MKSKPQCICLIRRRTQSHKLRLMRRRSTLVWRREVHEVVVLPTCINEPDTDHLVSRSLTWYASAYIKLSNSLPRGIGNLLPISSEASRYSKRKSGLKSNILSACRHLESSAIHFDFRYPKTRRRIIFDISTLAYCPVQKTWLRSSRSGHISLYLWHLTTK